MMIHMHVRESYSDEKFKSLLAEDWTKAAVYYYQCHYNFDEKSESEHDLIRRQWWPALVASIPENLKIGIHLLATDAAYMGEDIYVVDGSLTHPRHAEHAACETSAIVSFKKRDYCVTCRNFVVRSEIKSW